MKLLTLLGKAALATGAVAAGLGSGSWVNQAVHQRATPLRSTSANPQDSPEVAPAAATLDSLLHYQFTPGERLMYGLSADISGSGIESLAGAGGVAMAFQSVMQVLTERVDGSGNGYLDIRFTDVQMQGSFMDAPVSLSHSLTGTEYQHGSEHISTAAGDSIAGIPQLEFFNTPTKATVTPAGVVLEVSGAPGMDQMIAPEQLVASVQFPAGELDAGAQWESEFGMPVPGVGTVVPSRTLNELVGFDLYRGRYCAKIRQTIIANQEGGTLNSPQSALGDEMNFSMPLFNLSGENTLYFDVDAGQLVDAYLDLTFSMRIGEELKAVAGVLDIYGKLLNELEGSQTQDAQPKEDLLNLGVNIRGQLSLLEQ
jgi:hypothetical protein